MTFMFLDLHNLVNFDMLYLCRDAVKNDTLQTIQDFQYKSKASFCNHTVRVKLQYDTNKIHCIYIISPFSVFSPKIYLFLCCSGLQNCKKSITPTLFFVTVHTLFYNDKHCDTMFCLMCPCAWSVNMNCTISCGVHVHLVSMYDMN